MIIVPTDELESFWEQTTTLDGAAYKLRFALNQRAACWYLDLLTLEGEAIACGMKLVCHWDLLRSSATPLRPPGRLYVLSKTTDLSTPGLLDFAPDGRCYLVYVTAAEIALLQAGGDLP